MNIDIDTWKPDLNFDPNLVHGIATRHSDYDPLGHVNSALYFDYLEAMVCQAFQNERKIQNIIIQFTKEIPQAIAEVKIGMLPVGDKYMFKLFSSECVHAAGELSFFSEHPN